MSIRGWPLFRAILRKDQHTVQQLAFNALWRESVDEVREAMMSSDGTAASAEANPLLVVLPGRNASIEISSGFIRGASLSSE